MPIQTTIDLYENESSATNYGSKRPWYTFALKNVNDVVAELSSDIQRGLSRSEASKRLSRYGLNELTADDAQPIYMKFLEQFKQPLILLLLGSAVVSVLLGQYDDAFSISLAILIVVTVAFVQEYRSEKSLEALNKLVPHQSHVIRDGVASNSMALDLVPGDLIKFAVGDRIPADVRVISAVDLRVDESNLTGETAPQKKTVDALLRKDVSELTQCTNICFMGTLVRQGHGQGIVFATGQSTEFGNIWQMMNQIEDKKTPLQENMESLGKQLSIISFCIIGVITVVGLLQGHPLLQTFNVAVSLAVAAIPEGLPIVVTVTLALGVMRMASRKAIVKRLPSVESLSAVNVICADKTGTLTMNRMSVVQYYTLDQSIQMVQEGSLPHQQDSIKQLLQTGVLCNNASINGDRIGQSTELSLLDFAQKLHFPDRRLTTRRLAEVPFNSDQKWMSVQVEFKSGDSQFHVKGAPEVVLEMCQKVLSGQKHVIKSESLSLEVLQNAKHMASNGNRVLALAHGSDMQSLVFIGMVGIYDPPRSGVAESIQKLQQSGVKVVMITGDSQDTAMSIARQLNILPSQPVMGYSTFDDSCLSGSQWDRLGHQDQLSALRKAVVFYRTTPQHKVAIVKQLQELGNVVGMTGDGVNDAIALKAADIGISMGISGTDVSKEAAAMILVDDNFATILNAIEEGKAIFHNIKNFLTFQLSTSAAALSLIALSTVFGLKAPLNPMQILWINIIMDGPPAQSLGVEPADRDVMQRPPRSKNDPMIDRRLLQRVLTAAFVIVTGTMLMYVIQLQDGEIIEKDITMTFTTFVFFDMFNAMSCRSENKSVFTIGLLSNKPLLISIGASVLGQMMLLYVPLFQKIFQTVPLSFFELVSIILLASTVLIVDEVIKVVLYGSAFRKYTLIKSRQGFMQQTFSL
ncbi:hypothetical protein MP228_004563 [Amoeboaphelidium protococcarum]|nr:hypothetical protein MP228_004563 [Amoeboaphelidium protococcarum]